MNTIEFLKEIRKLGIKVWVEDGRLRFSAPKGAMTPEIRQQLSIRKSEITKFLHEAGKENTKTPPLEVVSRTNTLPLSVSQEALWFLHQTNPGMSAYNMYDAVRLKGPLRVEILERALQEIVSRHESLRTTFPAHKGQPFQSIAPPGGFVLSKSDLRETPENEREKKLCRLVMDEVQKPFDLAEGPLFRAWLFQLGDEHYLLLLTVHHSISDGASIVILRRELSALYSAFSQCKDSPLLDLPIQYADFSVWQRTYLESDDFKGHIAYWKQRLPGIPSALELPTDHVRPPVQTFRGETKAFTIPSILRTGLREIGKKQDSSLFMVLLSAFNILLYRYSGQDDIVVGVPVSGRNLPETQNIQGFFVNTLTLRTNLSGKQSFIELLGQLRENFLDAMSHENVPFEKLVAALQPKRDQSRNPIFQVSFEFEVLAQKFELPGLQATSCEVERGASQFDLAFFLEESESGIRVKVEYNTDLFVSATISRFVGHYLRLLSGIIENPECSISKLPLLTPEEEKQILIQWNENHTDYPSNTCIHRLVEERVARSPEAVALTCNGQSLTYRQLNAQSNKLARELRTLGVGPDVLVGICMERSNDLVVGLLAILKAGGAYLPIDLAYPAERLAFMLTDAKAPVLLTQTKLTKDLPETSAKVLCADSLLRQTETPGDDENPPATAGPDHLAYVIYTSGTTGKPKGSCITHRNVTRLFSATEQWYHFNHQDVWSLFHSYAFDFSVWEIWGALLYGGRLVVVPYMVSRSPEAFYKLLVEERVTVLNQTPSAFRQLIQAEEAVGQKNLALRYVIFGGEALEMQSLRPWFERHGDKQPRLVNMYGITETTVHVTYRPLSKDDLQSGSVIGVPIPDLRVYILDSERQPVPIGVPGEMYVGGAGLARGYLGRPELTAERFIPDHITGRPEPRLYRTGDLARYLPGRDIEYLGRIDQQVKIRGFRVELGEIESVLCQHPVVREATVLLREDTPGNKRLVAYLVTDGKTPSVNELREHLKKKMPDYMVPAAFVPLEKIPLTNNGKVDRKALPEPSQDRPDMGRERVAPSTETEKELCRIWTEVLGVDQISIHDDFFDLGGHSLMVLRAISLINDRFGSDLPPVTLFENPTVAGLCAILKTGGHDEQVPVGEPKSDRPTSGESHLRPKVDLALVTETVAKRSVQPSWETPRRRYRMRESLVCRWILAPLYSFQRGSVRSLLQVLILKLEGGMAFTVTLRKLYAKHHDIYIGDYSGLFDFNQIKAKTRIGRYTSIHPTVIVQNAEHPKNTLSSSALFYHPAFGYTEGYELDRVEVEIGNDVFIGQNAMILYPTKRIGDGAVIAAGSVVVKDVPPYAIVGGYPAEVLGYRFSKEIIAELLKSRWWEASLEQLEAVKDQFTRPLEGEKIR